MAGLQVGQSFRAIPVPDPPLIRRGANGPFYDKGLEGASHHAVIPNVNTIDKLREVWPRLSSDEKKLFDVIARAYLAALMPVSLLKISTRLRKAGDFRRPIVPSPSSGAILSAVLSIFAFRFRGRASLEIELIALRHQVTVLRRQRPGRPQLSSLDRLLWVWLYRIWPQVIDAMVLVKPATVVQWHRNGFRFSWRWRSRRPGRPKMGIELRALIRRHEQGQPVVGGAQGPRGLLKLGIEISQATVGRWMPWRPRVPSPTWQTFLRNHLPDIAAIDMFVVATATFRLLYALIVAKSRPQTGCSFRGHHKSHAKLALAPDHRGLSLGHCTALSAAGPGQIVWPGIPPSRSWDGHHGGHHCGAITLAEPLRRTSHRFDPP